VVSQHRLEVRSAVRKVSAGAMKPEAAPGLYRTRPGRGSARARPAAALMGLTAEQAIAKGLMFAGNPDTVYRQIMEHRERVGPTSISSLPAAPAS